MRILLGVTASAVLCLSAAFGQKKLVLGDLPPQAQKTIQDTLKGGEIKNIGKETEHGIAQYEVETMLNGKHRDFNVGVNGKLIVVEEETAIDSVAPAAKAAILKKVGTGKLRMVELVIKGGETMYEAAYTSQDGKKHEVLVKADGAETKD
jgi:uncharacterized membrane protein YkoI